MATSHNVAFWRRDCWYTRRHFVFHFIVRSLLLFNENMIDLCDLNQSKCLNNGTCAVNMSSNTTYCQCDECHWGTHCEADVLRTNKYDIFYAHFVVYIIELCLSLLNNGLVFELFICCRRIRSTNCGIYLFVYSILSLLSNIFIVTEQALEYYRNSLIINPYWYAVLDCYFNKIGYTVLTYLCIWLSSCIAFERGLFIWFDTKLYTHWRSCVTIIVILAIAIGSATPMLVYKCDWDNVPKLQMLRFFFVWFYIIAGIATYIVVMILVLISFAIRIHKFGIENDSRIKKFLNLLKTHLLIFVPPITYIICQLPYTIIDNTQNPEFSFFICGISLAEFIVRVILDALPNTPYALTWLLFVYPSRVYMTDYYLETWSGQRLANIIIFFQSYNNRRNISR